ncbi:MAG: immunoglobulin domain-containing protein [Chloroflexi bacterium]|nr:immunoglobulin domain-containing protein [Chloroflexota bacterium]
MKKRFYQHPRLNCFQERWTGSIFVIAAATLALSWAQMAQAQTHTVIKHFGIPSKVTGLNPRAPLVQGPDGTLYGTASSGEGHGTVFKIQPDGTGFAVLKCFTNSVKWAEPHGGLVLSGGTLYGTTFGTAQMGNISGYGTVFKVNTDGTGYTVLKSFTGSEGLQPRAGLVLSGGTLYGTTQYGGSSGYGTVFKMNTNGTGYTVLKSFTGGDGKYPSAGLVLSDGTLYGTAGGGGSDKGVVFKVNTNGTGYTVLKSFTGSDGADPLAGLVLSGGTLYGTTYSGGSSGGTVFKVNTNDTGYTVLTSFAGRTYAGLVLSGDTLYGTITYGGSSGNGAVFKVNTDGAGYTVLKNFTGSDGAKPFAGLVLSGGTLYGTTYNGGSSDEGTVYKVNTDGTGYAVLKNFTRSDVAAPFGGLVLSSGTLYGTTYFGGSSNAGSVFKVNTNGTGYTVLRSFTGSDGSLPRAGLVLSGGTLYGTTPGGGSSGKGTVFKINTNGTGYTLLTSFTGGSDGSWPRAGLVLSGGTLYGTTYQGGISDWGTVFKVNTDGTGYAVLKKFGSSDGWGPQSDLVLSGSTLYGTTWDTSCEDPDHGTVFKVNTDGTGYAMLRRFTDSDGSGPQALVLSGDTLYGMTTGGGNLANGTVFRIDLSGGMAPVIDSQPQSRVNLVGTTASFSVTAIGTAPLTCQWRKDGVNLADGVQSSGAAISGTTTGDLTMANVQMSDAGDYTVVVTNTYGSVTSSVAALTVQLPTPILTADGSGTNGFGFNLRGMAGQTVVIDASANLTSWTPLLTNSLLTGDFYFNDPGSTNTAQRFYRARLTP